MALAEPAKLTVYLEALGREVRGITRWEIDSDYLVSTDGFSFETYSETPEFGLELQPVRLELDGRPQLVGRIDSSEIGSNGGSISYQGRDYIADLVECRIDPSFEIKEGEPLETAMLKAAGPVGITTIIDDGSGDKSRDVRMGKKSKAKKGKDKKSKKQEDNKPDFGAGIYDFLNRLVARHAATIQPTLSRNELLISTPNYDQPPAYSIIRKLGDSSSRNNVKQATARRDFSSVPSHTLFSGNQVRTGTASVSLNILQDLWKPDFKFFNAMGAVPIIGSQVTFSESKKTREAVTSIGSKARQLSMQLLDTITRGTVQGRRKGQAGAIPNGLLYRLLSMRDPEAKNQEMLEATANRAISERLKETLTYDVTVQGHIDPVSGAAWTIDTIAQVEDEVCNISEPMWIAKRTFRFDEKGGAETAMKLWRPWTFLPPNGKDG